MAPDEPWLEADDGDLWGRHMAIPNGSIVEPGRGVYRHRFGGDSWHVIDADSVYGGPTLLLTLDLSDPILAAIQMPGVDELPLASYINCTAFAGRQVFRLEPQSHALVMKQREVVSPTPLPDDLRFPNPLPEAAVRLRPMSEADWPLDEESWERLHNEVLGGPNFIRVLGPPMWFDYPLQETCSCGASMSYVCCIGYEVQRLGSPQLGGFIPDRPFFVGEGSLYFFLCKKCREIAVVPQST